MKQETHKPPKHHECRHGHGQHRPVQTPSDAAAASGYTCPMHPEIRQTAPATARNAVWRWNRCCLILDDDNPDTADFSRRFLVHAAADRGSAGAGDVRPALGWMDMAALRSWVELVLSLPIVLWAGLRRSSSRLAVAGPPQPEHVDADQPRYRRGLRYSVVAALAPGVFPHRSL
jgi:Cu+-exporting ATPase